MSQKIKIVKKAEVNLIKKSEYRDSFGIDEKIWKQKKDIIIIYV